MNERQLRYALAVRDEGGFSRAAERLRVSQPSVSQQVRLLEDDLGFLLFARTTTNGVEVTFLGRKFLDRSEQAIAELTSLAEVARQLRRGPVRGCGIGISSGISPFVVPIVAEALRPRLDKLRIEACTAPSPRVQSLVAREALDLGIVVGISGRHILADLCREAVGTIEMSVFVAPDHRLCRNGGPVDLAEIAREPLIASEPRGGYGELVNRMFADRRLQPNIVAISDSVGAIKLLVRSGIGIAILPALCAPVELRSGELVRIALLPPSPVSVEVVHRRRHEDPLISDARHGLCLMLRDRFAREMPARDVA